MSVNLNLHTIILDLSCGLERDAQVGREPVRPDAAPVDSERQRHVALVQRMAAGDEGALAEFYDAFSSALYGIALHAMRCQQDAEDVLQDAFLYLWRKAAAYNPQLSSPFSWAVLVVRHKSIDRIRSRQRVERIAERALFERCAASDIDDRSCVEPLFIEQRKRVCAALDLLAEDQRRALELAFFSGLTHEEIAERTGTPLGTVKARIRRGMLCMRRSLEEVR